MGSTFTTSVHLFIKTLPFLILKAVIYSVTTLLFAVIVIPAYFVGINYEPHELYLAIGGIGFAYGIFKLIQRYILYLVKAGHVAVLAQLIVNGDIPMHGGMLRYGYTQVKTKFATSSVFFLVDELITGVIRVITAIFDILGNLLMIPILKTIFKIAEKILTVFLGYMDEAILSYIFIHPSENPWHGAKDGLILYFKSWKQLLKTSVFIVLIGYVATALIFGILYFALDGLSSLFNNLYREIIFLLAIFISWLFKIAILDQFTLIWIIVTYYDAIKGVSVDLETTNQLTSISQFKKILDKTNTEAGVNQEIGEFLPVNKNTRQTEDPTAPIMSYIKEMREMKYTDEQIKTLLLQQNWNPTIVTQALKK